ncbi:MAG: hypothetical protein CMJ75_19190 [Planctomycetaceae bacterium]|nr:hypothetical protein [Planctomycetaceae bacterium]
MTLALTRVELDAGDEYRVRFRDGSRGVYLIEGDCSPLKYGKPINIKDGHMVKVKAKQKSTIGVIGEKKP